MNLQEVANKMASAAMALQKEQSTEQNQASVYVCIEPMEDDVPVLDGAIVGSASNESGDIDRRVGDIFIPLSAVTEAIIARKRQSQGAYSLRVSDSVLYSCGAYMTCNVCKTPEAGDVGANVLYRAHVSVCDLATTAAYSKAAAREAISALKDYVRKENEGLYIQP